MSKLDTKLPFPPHIKKAKSRLTLKTAIAAAARSKGKIVKPLMDPLGEFPAIKAGEQTARETNLLELQADIIIREDFLNEKVVALRKREREIDEREALLAAHQKVVASSASKTSPAHQKMSS